MKTSSAILVALLGVGLYLLYKSLANIQSSLGHVGTTLNGELSTLNSAGSTLYHEAGALGSSLLSPVTALGSLGTSAYNGVSSFFGSTGSTTTGLSSDLGTFNLGWGDTSLAPGVNVNPVADPITGGSLNDIGSLHFGTSGPSAIDLPVSESDLTGALPQNWTIDTALLGDGSSGGGDFLDFYDELSGY